MRRDQPRRGTADRQDRPCAHRPPTTPTVHAAPILRPAPSADPDIRPECLPPALRESAGTPACQSVMALRQTTSVGQPAPSAYWSPAYSRHTALAALPPWEREAQGEPCLPSATARRSWLALLAVPMSGLARYAAAALAGHTLAAAHHPSYWWCRAFRCSREGCRTRCCRWP